MQKKRKKNASQIDQFSTGSTSAFICGKKKGQQKAAPLSFIIVRHKPPLTAEQGFITRRPTDRKPCQKRPFPRWRASTVSWGQREEVAYLNSRRRF